MHAGTCQPAAATCVLQGCRVAARRLRRRVAERSLQRLVRRARALHRHPARTASLPSESSAKPSADRERLPISLIELETSAPAAPEPECPCARLHRSSLRGAMAREVAPTATLVKGQDLQTRRRWARARPQATTAYRHDRASALLAMRMVSRTAASALSARSQRSCLCSRRVRRCDLPLGPLRGAM